MEKERMKKVKSDFILLSEFAEIRHGPQPLLTIPNKAEGLFDISTFSVRVFSTDFQQSSDESFSICPDAQVLITEPCDGAYAYVHYFALNDIQARGYLRQYCICYITNSINKLVDNFESMKEAFSEVTRLYKCGNHIVFSKDLDHRIADIEYSRQQIHLMSEQATIENQKEYNSRLEDIPESNDSVLEKDNEYILGIMNILTTEMKTKSNQAIYLEMERKNTSNHIKNVSYTTTGNSKFYTSPDIIDLPEQDVYKPQRVMAHVSQRFSRQLRTLDDLSGGATNIVINALEGIHKFYSRSEVELGIESIELNFVSPVSSLISVGRLPLCNLLKCMKLSNNYKHLLHQHNYIVTSVEKLDNDVHSYTMIDNGNVELFNTSFIDADDVSETPLYFDIIPRQRGLSIIDPLATNDGSLMINKRCLSGLSCSSYTTPDTFPTPPESPNDEIIESEERGHLSEEPVMKDILSEEPVMKDHSSEGPIMKDHLPEGPVMKDHSSDDPDIDSFKDILTDTGNSLFLFNDRNVERRGFPFISTTCLIDNKTPGSLLLQYFKDLPELRDILYSILIGIPFVIIAHPKDKRIVKNHIKALWVFVGGHSRECQIIPWQETSLTLKQLYYIKLVGLSADSKLHNNIKKHVSYWDWTNNTLVAPKYTGVILNPILNRSRDRKDSSVYLSIVICVLADIACKVFLYYHGYCIQPPYCLCKPKLSPPEISAKKLFSVSPEKDKVNFLNNARVKDSDVDIIEYWIDIVTRQQLKEWRSHCSLCHQTRESQNTIRLKMKYSIEKICKPKRQ